MTTRLLCLLMVAVLVGCSAPPPREPAGPQSSTRLAATLVTPTDVRLNWTGDEPNAAGRIVEYAHERNGQYTILEFVSLGQATFTHPDLIPETPFYYRVRPVFGPTTGTNDLALPTGPVSEADREGDQAWAPPRTVPGGPVAKQSIRDPATAAAAAPVDLTATVMHASGIKFTWTDRATDEEGYLLEVKPASSAEFGVAMILDPDINSVGLITLPNERTASFRVRAFYYGQSSNVAQVRTGKEQQK